MDTQDYNFDDHYKKEYNNRRDMNLVKMILNLDHNDSNDYKKPSDVYETYIKMPEMNYNTVFRNSLQKSNNCMKNPSYFRNSLMELNTNNPDSFLVLPLHGKGHLWSTVIKKTDEGFNAIIVNKGFRYWHDPLEEFVFKSEKIDKLIDTLNYSGGRSYENIEDVYRKFISNSDVQYNLSIKTGPQKVGNCFTKNIQAGIKIAQATRNISSADMRKYRMNTPYTSFGTDFKNKATLKWENMSTEDMQLNFVEKIIDKNPAIKDDANTAIRIYTENKHFMESIKQKSDLTSSFIKAFDSENTTSHLSKPERIKSLVKNLTPYTFNIFNKEVETIVNESKDQELINSFADLNKLDTISKYFGRSTYFTLFMEAEHDTLNSLERIYDREGKLANLPEKEKALALLNELTINSLRRYDIQVCNLLSKFYTKDEMDSISLELEKKAIEKTKDIKNNKSESYKQLTATAKFFPLISDSIRADVSDYFYLESNYHREKTPQRAIALLKQSKDFESNIDNFITTTPIAIKKQKLTFTK